MTQFSFETFLTRHTFLNQVTTLAEPPLPLGLQRATQAVVAASPPEDLQWWRAIQSTLVDRQPFTAVDIGDFRCWFVPQATAGGGLAVPVDKRVNLTDVIVGERADDLAAPLTFAELVFPRVRERAGLLRVLKRSDLAFELDPVDSSAYCDVATDAGLTALSKEQLRNVDRLRRRAEREHGAVAVETFVDQSVANEAFERFLRIEDTSWKGADGSGTSLALDGPGREFFLSVMQGFSQSGRARIDVLTLGGRDAAAHLAVRTDTTWFLLKIGYNPEFRAVGPGGILLRWFLDVMRADPSISEVNLTTNPAWAHRWHFRTEPLYNVRVFSNTVPGRYRRLRRRARALAVSARNRLRKALNSRPE